MSAAETLSAYVDASAVAWRTFIEYRAGRATEAQVAKANKAESDALASLQMAIDALESSEVTA